MARKGQKTSDEVKAKLRAKGQAQWQDQEKRQQMMEALHQPGVQERKGVKIGNFKRGEVQSEETKAKRRASMQARWDDGVYREQAVQRLKETDAIARGITPERNAKVGTGIKASWARMSEEDRKARGRAASERLANGNRGKKGHTLSPEAMERMRQTKKQQWIEMSPEKRMIVLTRLRSAMVNQRGPTSIEVMVATVLDTLQIAYIPEKPYGPYSIDFYLPDRNIALECDGDYWHGRPKQKIHDARRDAWFQRRGVTTIRMTETAIRADAHAAVISALAIA